MSDLPPPSPSSPEPQPPVNPVVPAEPAPAPSPSAEASTPPADAGGDPKPKDNDEKTLGLVMHLLPLSGLLLAKIPFVGIIAPLVLWLIKKDQSPYLDAVGKEVLNFQINLNVLVLVGILMCVVPGIIIAIAGLVMIVIAAVKTQGGEFYRFPWIIRVIK